MGKEKKDKGSKKGAMGVLTAVLVPILIVLLIACALFAIIYAIIELIIGIVTDVISNVLDFLQHPVTFVKSKWAKLTNWLDKEVFGGDSFNPDEYSRDQLDPEIAISDENFEEMKTQLDNIINRNTAGLEDIMLKKMLLSYFRGIYLDDTTILIELTNEDFGLTQDEWDALFTTYSYFDEEELKFREGKVLSLIGKAKLSSYGEYKPFEIVGGNSHKGPGEFEKVYLKSKGIVEVYNNNDKKIIFYTEDALDSMYNKHYIESFEDGNSGYANDVLDYLEKCYTYSEGGIKMYTRRVYENDELIGKNMIVKNGNSVEKDIDVKPKEEIVEQNIQINNIVAEYTTPVEFMVALLEITASKDFVDAFIETVGESSYVKLKLYETESSEIKTVLENKERTIDVYNRNEILDTEEKLHSWTRDVTESTRTKNGEEKLDIAVIEAKTWYSTIKYTNNINNEVKIEYLDKDNNRIQIDPQNTDLETLATMTIKREDIVASYSKQEYPDIFEEVPWLLNSFEEIFYLLNEDKQEEASLKIQYNMATEGEFDGNKIEVTDKEINNSTCFEVIEKVIAQDIETPIENYNLFLGLLRNKEGKYKLGESYKPKESGGKLVEYEDLYGKQTAVGEMLVNGAEMLFKLLEQSENTQNLVNVMKYILYKYSNNNYGITDFEFEIMGNDGYIDIDLAS